MSTTRRPAPMAHYSRAERRAVGAAQLSNDTILQFTRTDYLILHWLLWLQRCARRDRPDRVPYAWCRQEWLAEKCGVSREWICRRTGELARLGVIRKIWRRPQHGKYQTCLYLVGVKTKWLLGRLLHRLASPKRPESVMNTSHKPTNSISMSGVFTHAFANLVRRQ